MNVYLGQTRSHLLIESLNSSEHGFCEMTSRGEFPPRRFPWAYDNGAFKDWMNNKPFKRDKFLDEIAEIKQFAPRPDFIVLPDIVGGGERSLDFSFEWIPHLLRVAPLYLAVQDGMDSRHIEEISDYIDGVLVGGTLSWKLQTAEIWVKRAHALGKKCHVGRAGTANRVAWCQRIGADSLDSCLPLWSKGNWSRFVEGLTRYNKVQELGFDPKMITHVC
jgi:hypothetical protein